MINKLEIRNISVSELREPSYNPRVPLVATMPEYQQIQRAIEQFGLVEPLVVNEHNMNVVGGNQRLRVMRDMGYAEVPCVLINELDELREKKLCVGLNKIDGRWDEAKLAELLCDDALYNEFETGVTQSELEKYLELSLEDAEPEDAEPELEEDTDESETSERVAVKLDDITIWVPFAEYAEAVERMRDAGMFSRDEIKNEFKRRLLTNGAFDSDGGDSSVELQSEAE